MMRDSSGISSPREAVGVAASVDVLVVMEHPPRLLVELGGRDDRIADLDVAAHRGRSSASSGPGFWRIGPRRRSCRRRAAGRRVGAARADRPRGRAPHRSGRRAPRRSRSGCACPRPSRRPRCASAVASSRWWCRVARSSGGAVGFGREAVGVDDDPAAGPLRLVEREVGAANERVGALERRSTRRCRRLTDAGADGSSASRWRRWANVKAPHARSSGSRAMNSSPPIR